MKLPQIIRFSDYLKETPSEAVRTVLYQDQHDNMVLWQIPPQTMLPAQPEAFDFPYFFANFPSPVTCSKQDTTPALTLTLDDATSGGLPQSGLLLSFRQDYFDELGDTVVHELLNRLSALLQAGLRLRKQTQYAYPYKDSLSDVWQDCIMDLFPTHAAELTKKGWDIKKDFAGWAKF